MRASRRLGIDPITLWWFGVAAVLLLVLQAQLQMLQCLFIEIARRQPRLHLRIDLLAVVSHLLQRRARQQPALWPRMRETDWCGEFTEKPI